MHMLWKLVVIGILTGCGMSGTVRAGYVWTENASGVYGGTGTPWVSDSRDGKRVVSGTANTFTGGAAVTSSDGPLTVSGTGTVLTVAGSRLKVNGNGVLTIENAVVNGAYVDPAAGIRIGTEGSTGTVLLKSGSLVSTAASVKNIFIGSDNEESVGIVRSSGNSSIAASAVYVGVRGNSSHVGELSVEDGTLSVTGAFNVGGFEWGGNYGYGRSFIKSGATLKVTGNTIVGHTGIGTLDVSGNAALTGNLIVGNYYVDGETPLSGTGTLFVRNGGTLTVSGNTAFGHSSSWKTASVSIEGNAVLKAVTISRATASVSGSMSTAALTLSNNSTLTVSGSVTSSGNVALQNSAVLTISKGGVMNSGSSEFQLNSPSAAANVYGTLICGNQINFNSGVLSVYDGGTVQFQGNGSGFSRVGNASGNAGILRVYAGGTVIDRAGETMVARSDGTIGHIFIDGGTYLAENENTGRGLLCVGGHSNDSAKNVTASLQVLNGGTLKVNTLYFASVGAGSTVTGTLGNLNTDKISVVSAKVNGLTVGWHYASDVSVNYADVDVSRLSVQNNSTLNINGGADIDVAGAFSIAAGSTVRFNANALGMGNISAASLSSSGTIHLGVSGIAPMNAKSYTIYNGGGASGFTPASAGVWTVAKDTDRVTVTLSETAKIGNYNMESAPLSFEDASSGWVQLGGLTTDRYELTFTTSELTSEQSGAFVEWLNESYDGSGILAAALTPTTYQLTGLQNLADTAFLAWDFTGFEGAVTAMNSLSGHSVPEPAAWFLMILGLAVLRPGACRLFRHEV